MMNSFHNINLSLVARVLMGLFYLVMAAGLVKDFGMLIGLMEAKHVPMPDLLLPITIFVWVLGAAALIFGIRVREGALLLILLTAIVTPVIHNFWAAPPEIFASELQHFFKNIAIIAGLFSIAGSQIISTARVDRLP